MKTYLHVYTWIAEIIASNVRYPAGQLGCLLCTNIFVTEPQICNFVNTCSFTLRESFSSPIRSGSTTLPPRIVSFSLIVISEADFVVACWGLARRTIRLSLSTQNLRRSVSAHIPWLDRWQPIFHKKSCICKVICEKQNWIICIFGAKLTTQSAQVT